MIRSRGKKITGGAKKIKIPDAMSLNKLRQEHSERHRSRETRTCVHQQAATMWPGLFKGYGTDKYLITADSGRCFTSRGKSAINARCQIFLRDNLYKPAEFHHECSLQKVHRLQTAHGMVWHIQTGSMNRSMPLAL